MSYNNITFNTLADMYIKDTSCDEQLFCGCRPEDCEAHGTKECRVCLLEQVRERMKEIKGG